MAVIFTIQRTGTLTTSSRWDIGIFITNSKSDIGRLVQERCNSIANANVFLALTHRYILLHCRCCTDAIITCYIRLCYSETRLYLLWFVDLYYKALPVLRSLIWQYSDVIMSAIASQITGVSIVYSTICSSVDQRKHQSSVSLAFVMGIPRWPVDSPHKGPVTRKIFPFDLFEAHRRKSSRWLQMSWCQINVLESMTTMLHRRWLVARIVHFKQQFYRV